MVKYEEAEMLAGGDQVGGVSRPEEQRRYNEIVRAAAHVGVPVLWTLRQDLVAAFTLISALKSAGELEKARQVRARARGLAQALATVHSPFTREEYGGESGAWMRVVQGVENEAMAVAKYQARQGDE